MKLSGRRFCALVGIASAISLFLGGAQPHAQSPAAPSGKNKIIIYPSANETIEQLKGQGISQIENYGSYWVATATDGQIDALNNTYGDRAAKANHLNQISLSAMTIDTTAGEPSIPRRLQQQIDSSNKRLRLIQFKGPVKPNWLDQMKAAGDVNVISYIPNSAYLIWLDSQAEQKLAGLIDPNGPVQWIGAYHPYYKISPELLSASGTESIKVRVSVVDQSQRLQAESGAYALGIVKASLKRDGQEIIEMAVPPSAIARIARLPDVLWIEKEWPKHILDEVQDLVLVTQTNQLPFFSPTPPPPVSTGIHYLDWLTNTVGGGMSEFLDPVTYPVVDVADTGLDNGTTLPFHPAFYNLGSTNSFSRVVYLRPPWLAGNPVSQLGCTTRLSDANRAAFRTLEAADLEGHGTFVASILAGFDTGTNIFSKPTLEVLVRTNNYALTIPGPEPGNGPCPVSNTNLTITIPAGKTSVCGPDVFTNITVSVLSNSCPTNLTAVIFPFGELQTNLYSEIRTDANGFQYGMGVSPYGLIGVNRVFGTMESSFFTIGVQGGACVPTYRVLGVCLTDFVTMMAEAYIGFARIENNSWADIINTTGDNGGQYNAESQTFDIGVRDAVLSDPISVASLNQEFIVVFACNSLLTDAGNQGNAGGFADMRVTAPATAKNVISVGSSLNPRFDCPGGGSSLDMFPQSAAGPTVDGRFKPEIVAVGGGVVGAFNQLAQSFNIGITGLTSTNCSFDDLVPFAPFIITSIDPSCSSTQTLYTALYTCGAGGSSFAAPAVSGAIQLLWWYFEHRLTNEVGKALSQPSPAMAKAYVCNSARYLPITSPQTGTRDTLPSILQGMGELDLARMFDGVSRVLRDESSPRALDVPLVPTNRAPQQTYFSQSGQTYELNGHVLSNGVPFRVTLAWLDAPGAIGVAKELVNDLDLQVTIGGQTYKGNVFSEDHSVFGGGFDDKNNLESVFLPTGSGAVTAGAPYQVIVRAATIAGPGVPHVGVTNDQDFALVVYNSGTGPFGTPTATSDSPNLTTNDTCQTAIIISNAFFAFTNDLTSSTYSDVHPSPTAGRGGIEEFFKMPVPAGGTPFTIFVSGTNAVTSIWRGECGTLEEVSSSASLPALISFFADGTNDYYIIVDGKNGGDALVQLNVSVACALITISPPSLPSGNIGQLYSQTLTATGGVPPYAFAVTSGSLPPGLSLSDTGALSGVPTTSGSFTFTVTATDVNGCTGIAIYTISITCPTITLLPASFPGTTLGSAYSQSSSAIGGTAPYTFAVTGGSLPPGLTYSSAGLLSGTPTLVGTYNFTITVTDAVGCTASRAYSLTVGCTPLTLTPQTLPNPAIGVFYSQTISASGTTGTVNFARTQGSLPTGLTLTSSGVVTGTPTAFGTFTFQVTAIDVVSNCQGSRFYTLKVGCPTLAVSPAALPFGNVGAVYSQTLTASGGTAPYTFTQTGGSLPVGITLSNSGTLTGLLSGIPTSGSSIFTLTLKDANGCQTNFTYALLLSNNCPSIVVSPSTLPSGTAGAAYSQTLSGSGGTSPYNFALISGTLPAGLTLSTAGVLSGTLATSGSFTFTVVGLDAIGCAGLQAYTLTIACDTITVSPSTLATGTIGVAYSQTLTVTGGLPPHTFAVVGGTLPSGLTVDDSGTLSGTPTAAGTFAFTVAATDTVSCTGSQLYSLTINPATDLAVSKSVSPDPTIVGSNVTYTIVVTNRGPSTATSVTVTDTLPSSVTFLDSSSGCIATGGVFACNLGSLVSGTSTTITIVATTTAEATITNTVTVFSTLFDFNSTNNTATTISDVGAVVVFGAGAQIVSANAGSASIRVARLGDTLGPITVQYASGNDTAVAGVDYVATAGSLTFDPGVTSQTFTVPILNGSSGKKNKSSKTVKLTLNNVSGAKLGSPSTAAIDIVGSPTKKFADADGDVVTVKLSGAGSMQASLSGNGTGPIDQIELFGTTAKSKLSITVKRGRHGDGFVNIGSIVAHGSLRSISAIKAKLVGAGIDVTGSLGSIRINGEKKSKVTAAGNVGTAGQ